MVCVCVCDVTIAVDQRAVLGSDPDIFCLLLRHKYANQRGAASRLNPALRLHVTAVQSTSEVLLLGFDVCVQLVIPEIKQLKPSLEADYSTASLAANAKRDRTFFSFYCVSLPLIYLINTPRFYDPRSRKF